MARQAEPARHAQGLLSCLAFTALRKAIGLLSSAARSAAIARIDFGDGQGGTILEFGTGSGDSLGLYPAGARIIGVDWRAEPLAFAAARMRRLGIHEIGGLAVVSPSALPFEDGAFATALASFALIELDDPSLALDELVRAVGPGGDIVIVDNFAHLRGGEANDGLAALITRPDLTLAATRQLPPFGLYTLFCLRVDARAQDGAGEGAQAATGPGGGPRRRRVARRALRHVPDRKRG